MALGVSFGAILALISFRHIEDDSVAPREIGARSRSLDRQELPAGEGTKNRKRPRVPSRESPLVAEIRVSFVTALAPH